MQRLLAEISAIPSDRWTREVCVHGGVKGAVHKEDHQLLSTAATELISVSHSVLHGSSVTFLLRPDSTSGDNDREALGIRQGGR